jgi:hypothetical protein
LARRDAQTIRQTIIEFLDARGSGIRDDAGEPVVDLVDAVSTEAERQGVIAEYLELTNSIRGWRLVIADSDFQFKLADALGVSATKLNIDYARRLGVPTDLASDVVAVIYLDLNRFAASQGRARRPAYAATGIERLYLASNNPYTLFRGAVVKTGGDAPVLYDTTTDLLAVPPSYDASRGQYYVDVGIRCRSLGSVGNRIRNSINAQQQTIPGAIAVTNPEPVTGGAQRETDVQLLDALEGSRGGNSVDTLQGLKNFVIRQSGVIDAKIIGPGHPLMQRATAGAVDVVVIGQNTKTDVVKVQVLGVGETYYLPYQPAARVSSAVGAAPYYEGGGYLFNPDSGVFRNTAQSVTSITWDLPPVGPAADELVTVTFAHNDLIRDLQRMSDEDPDVNVPGSSVLYREGDLIKLIFAMKVVALPGVTQSDAEGAVQSAINDHAETLLLGGMTKYSVALTAAQNAKINDKLVVDRIDDFKMSVLGSPLGTADIPALDDQYARLWDITFIAPGA